MQRFLKGLIVGLGGVAPGLSGSVLLIIFGLYQKTLDALGSLLKDLKKNLAFLAPLVAGMFAGDVSSAASHALITINIAYGNYYSFDWHQLFTIG